MCLIWGLEVVLAINLGGFDIELFPVFKKGRMARNFSDVQCLQLFVVLEW